MMHSPSIRPAAAGMPAAGPSRCDANLADPLPADPLPADPLPADPVAMEPLMIDPLAEPARFGHVAAAVALAAAREIGDFSAERLNAQAERIRSWSTARTPTEWLMGEMSFAAQSFANYAHEAAHLQEVMLEAAEAAAAGRR